jgi:uncharacterized protein (TIGR02145 family)
VAITLGVSCIDAQVTIGGDKEPSKGSLLSLNSDTRGGLQLSNVELISLTEIPDSFPGISGLSGTALDAAKNAFIGAMVYNTNSSFGKGKGIYVWSDTGWNYIGGGFGVPTGRLAFRDSPSGEITGWLDFMTYNLGATPMTINQQKAYPYFTVPASYADEAEAFDFKTIYGDLYQWGRNTDGHEKVWSDTSTDTVPADKYTEAGDKFVTAYGGFGGDWLDGTNSKLGRWGGQSPNYDDNYPASKGINDPCPDGFRVPSIEEWQGISNGVGGGNISDIPVEGYNGVNKWVWHDGGTTVGSSTVSGWLIYPPKPGVTIPVNDEDYEDTPTLFLPATLLRDWIGNIGLGLRGWYWSSTADGSSSHIMRFSNSTITNQTLGRGTGMNVRCIKEH